MWQEQKYLEHVLQPGRLRREAERVNKVCWSYVVAWAMQIYFGYGEFQIYWSTFISMMGLTNLQGMARPTKLHG